MPVEMYRFFTGVEEGALITLSPDNPYFDEAVRHGRAEWVVFAPGGHNITPPATRKLVKELLRLEVSPDGEIGMMGPVTRRNGKVRLTNPTAILPGKDSVPIFIPNEEGKDKLYGIVFNRGTAILPT